jgi:hypothetical protein
LRIRDGVIALQHRQPYVSPDRVKRDITCMQGDTQRPTGPTQKRLDARDELGHGKRFHQVIVRAGVQTGYPRLHCVPRRENQDGNAVLAAAQMGEQIQPVAVRQSEVENSRVVSRNRERLPRVGT